MWGLRSLKDSVQTHAADLFRNISDRMGGECETDDAPGIEQKSVSKDAMKNVVTPKSIPQFTLPPLLTYESPPSSPTDVTWQEPIPHITMRGWAPSQNERNGQLQVAKSCRNGLVNDKNKSQGGRTPTKEHSNGSPFEEHGHNGSASLSALSIKSLVQRTSSKKSADKLTPAFGQEPEDQQEAISPKNGRRIVNAKSKRDSYARKQKPEQPGLGLQHLLSTRSGFSTLSESPNTRRKESLFLSDETIQNCDGQERNKKFLDRTRSCSPSYADHSARRRFGAKSCKSHEKSLERGYRSAELSCNSDQENSDSDSSIASYPDGTNGSPLLHRIRSRRFMGRNYSPECDSNNSSAYSTPQGSPSPSARSFAQTQSKHCGGRKMRAGKQVSETADGRLRRLSMDEDSTLLRPSNSEGKLCLTNNGNQRLCASAHNVNTVDDGCSVSKLHPSIRVCLTYLPQHKRLNISILEGKHFVQGHTVYLKVTLLPRHDRGHRTEPIKLQSTTPSIRERLTFDCVLEEDIPHMSLKICCKEKLSRIRHADVVGECILALCDINFQKSNDVWANLRPFEEEEAPHIQLSLCYDAMLGCLTVDVVAARNLPKGSLGRQPDSFVTLAEVLPNAKVAKKQTKVAHRTQDPVFQESFLFSLCTDAQTPDELVIIATLFVKDRVRGSTEPMGSAKLGQLVNSWSGRSQWAQALANEGEPITCWHALQASQL